MKKLLMLILVLMTGFNCLNASQKGEDPNEDPNKNIRKKLTSGGLFNMKKEERPEKRKAEQNNQVNQGDYERATTSTEQIHSSRGAFKPSPKRPKINSCNGTSYDDALIDQIRKQSNQPKIRLSLDQTHETNDHNDYDQISGSGENTQHNTPKKVAVRQINSTYFNVNNIQSADEIYEKPVLINPDYQSNESFKAPDLHEGNENLIYTNQMEAEAAFIECLHRSASQLSLRESLNQTPSSSAEKQKRSSSNPTPLIIYPGNAHRLLENPFMRSSSVLSILSLPAVTKKEDEDDKSDIDSISEKSSEEEETFGFEGDEEQDEIDETK